MMEKGDDHNILAEQLTHHNTADDMNLIKSNNDTTDKLNTNYDVLVDGDVDECVNNQNICNNRKNVKPINKTDCNVVIDDDTKQSKCQQSQQSDELKAPIQPQLKKQSTYGCVHYKRKAKFVVSESNQFSESMFFKKYFGRFYESV